MTRHTADSRQRPPMPSALRQHYYGERIMPMQTERRGLLAWLTGGRA